MRNRRPGIPIRPFILIRPQILLFRRRRTSATVNEPVRMMLLAWLRPSQNPLRNSAGAQPIPIKAKLGEIKDLK
jgi:hypothetical protein